MLLSSSNASLDVSVERSSWWSGVCSEAALPVETL